MRTNILTAQTRHTMRAVMNSLRSAAKWIVKVPQTLSEQKRLAQFLSLVCSLVMVVSVFCLIGLLLTPQTRFESILFIALSGVGLLSYMLNRRGYYRVAAWCLIAIFIIVSICHCGFSEYQKPCSRHFYHDHCFN
jgi:hypothetical protein